MKFHSFGLGLGVACALLMAASARGDSGGDYRVFVTNERSGTLTVIRGSDHKAVATIPLGKRPRGIQVGPDGKTLYIAVSGSPISPPPRLDEHGKPIPRKDDDEGAKQADKTADGVILVDAEKEAVIRKIDVGSDPEQLAISADGTRLYVSNEDAGTANVVNIASGKIERSIPVTNEPEGVTTSPDGKTFYVTCEDEGDVFIIETKDYSVVAKLRVGGRPRSVAFLPDGSRVFVSSESWGQVHVIDAVHHKAIHTIQLPPKSRPMCLVVSRDGKKLYASAGRGRTICVIDTTTYQVLNTIPAGERPWGIAISPDGRTLYAANGPSDDVSVIDLTTEKEIARVKAESSPWGVAIVSVRK